MKRIYREGLAKAAMDVLAGEISAELSAARASRDRQIARSAKAERRAQKKNKVPKAASPKIAKSFPIGSPAKGYDRASSGFYKSREWRELRYLCLKICGGRCMCCGASAATGATIHVDHIIPRYKAPQLSLRLDNLQVLCEDCNIGKGAWDSTSWHR